MIKVKIGNNVSQQTIIIEENATLLSAIEEAGLDPNRGSWRINTAPVGPGELQKTFGDCGVSDGGLAFLLNVENLKNAR